MPIYTVHVPRAFDDPVERAERTRFVRDGFSVSALVFGPLFLLRHRAWIAAAVWLGLVLAGAWLTGVLHLPPFVRVSLLLLLELFLGFEGNLLRRSALDRGGYDFADVAAGRRREDIELGFFRRHDEPLRGAASRPTPVASPARPYSGGAGPVIGSFSSQDG